MIRRQQLWDSRLRRFIGFIGSLCCGARGWKQVGGEGMQACENRSENNNNNMDVFWKHSLTVATRFRWTFPAAVMLEEERLTDAAAPLRSSWCL